MGIVGSPCRRCKKLSFLLLLLLLLLLRRGVAVSQCYFHASLSSLSPLLGWKCVFTALANRTWKFRMAPSSCKLPAFLVGFFLVGARRIAPSFALAGSAVETRSALFIAAWSCCCCRHVPHGSFMRLDPLPLFCPLCLHGNRSAEVHPRLCWLLCNHCAGSGLAFVWRTLTVPVVRFKSSLSHTILVAFTPTTCGVEGPCPHLTLHLVNCKAVPKGKGKNRARAQSKLECSSSFSLELDWTLEICVHASLGLRISTFGVQLAPCGI